MTTRTIKEDASPVLTEMLSPFVMKMITDSTVKYKKVKHSFSFGLKLKLGGKWIYILAIGIVAIVVILYLTGNLPTGR